MAAFAPAYLKLLENGELHRRVAQAYRHLRDCDLDARYCHVNRHETSSCGVILFLPGDLTSTRTGCRLLHNGYPKTRISVLWASIIRVITRLIIHRWVVRLARLSIVARSSGQRFTAPGLAPTVVTDIN